MLADGDVPLELMAGLLAASDRATYRSVRVISWVPSPVQPWTRAELHERLCAVTIELAEDGAPIRSFASWAELVNAAPLRLSVR